MFDMSTKMLPKHDLATRFQLSRRTIHDWVESGRGQLERELAVGAAGYARQPLVAHNPDPYKGITAERLPDYPQLTAQRLYDEVRAGRHG